MARVSTQHLSKGITNHFINSILPIEFDSTHIYNNKLQTFVIIFYHLSHSFFIFLLHVKVKHEKKQLAQHHSKIYCLVSLYADCLWSMWIFLSLQAIATQFRHLYKSQQHRSFFLFLKEKFQDMKFHRPHNFIENHSCCLHFQYIYD